jgi:hypothetical protein
MREASRARTNKAAAIADGFVHIEPAGSQPRWALAPIDDPSAEHDWREERPWPRWV